MSTDQKCQDDERQRTTEQRFQIKREQGDGTTKCQAQSCRDLGPEGLGRNVTKTCALDSKDVTVLLP